MQRSILSVQKIVSWLKNITANNRTNLIADSRLIKKGDIFFSYFVNNMDEQFYISDAIKRGAAAIVYEKNDSIWHQNNHIPFMKVKNLKNLAGFIANAYYDYPDKAMFTIAVTGTNGKTSCAYWLSLALSRLAGGKTLTAIIGTLGIGCFLNGELQQAFDCNSYTTPDAMLLQRKLVDLHILQTSILVIEASSIGLHQGRMNGLHIDVALFTNFTRDHLDYHGNMCAYAAAKVQLFNALGLQYAVINLDDELGQRLLFDVQAKGVNVIGYTLLNNINCYDIPIIRASVVRTTNIGTNFYIYSPYGTGLVKTHLVGQFNVSNVLGVLSVLLIRGVDLNSALANISMLTPVPGRMQKFGGGQTVPLVIVDYAHTPDALEKTLIELRQLALHRGGKLWCVFGCGGDRDLGKRSQMGTVSELADYVILTNDNPRSENPSAIISHIRSGMYKITPYIMEDRAAAILLAVQHSKKQDVILLAGKGHEKYQEIAGKKLPFFDADHVMLALATRTTMMKSM